MGLGAEVSGIGDYSNDSRKLFSVEIFKLYRSLGSFDVDDFFISFYCYLFY